MSNPRNFRRYDELDYHGTTFATDSSIVYSPVVLSGQPRSAQIGLAVALVAGQTAGLGVTGNPLLGKVKTVEADGNCAVQDRGYMIFSYPANDGTAPVVGGSVNVNGAGMVVKAAAQTNNEVVDVDTVNKVATVRVF